MEVSSQQTVYSVNESVGFVEVCVVLSGVLERNVTVSLFTVDISAVGKLCNSCSCVCFYICHLKLVKISNVHSIQQAMSPCRGQ